MSPARMGMAVVFTALLVADGTWRLARCEPSRLPFPAANRSADSGSFSYEPYAAALAKFVDQRGRVSYQALKADRGDLEAFVASLSRVSPEEFDSWSEARKIAFWINAYNALTLQAILDNYPIQSSFLRSVLFPRNSIRQIPGVWDKLRFAVLGRAMTLNDIEHDTLRAQFNEPRIHVALVCAAISCPPLRNQPYTAEKLDHQLDDQARAFLRGPHGLRVAREQGRVYLSSIFKWFGEDFTKAYSTAEGFAGKSATQRAVLNFVHRYAPEADRDFLRSGAYRVEYLDYDWSLNEQTAH